jgi:hypothetical protein
MTAENIPPEVCFDTAIGRICLPIASTGPIVPFPRRESSLQLGDKLIISESAQDLRRVLDLEAILVETLKTHDKGLFESRGHLARILAREAETVFEKAEHAVLRAGPYLSRFSEEISERLAASCRNDALPQELRDRLSQWRHQHPDLAGYIAGLPKAANATLCRYRETVDQALKDFVAGGRPTVELTCEGSTAGCAILGFLTGAAVATGNVPAAAVGVVGIGWCCG